MHITAHPTLLVIWQMEFYGRNTLIFELQDSWCSYSCCWKGIISGIRVTPWLFTLIASTYEQINNQLFQSATAFFAEEDVCSGNANTRRQWPLAAGNTSRTGLFLANSMGCWLSGEDWQAWGVCQWPLPGFLGSPLPDLAHWRKRESSHQAVEA